MDMHGYFGYAFISAVIHGHQQICMDNPIIHGYPFNIHGYLFNIHGYPFNIHGYPFSIHGYPFDIDGY